MKKVKKGISAILALSLSAVLLTGCGKNVEGVNQTKLIDKYAKNCTMGDYKSLTYEETKTTITDESVQDEIDSLLKQYTTTEQIKEGTVELGDSVNVDFDGYMNGEAFESGSSKGAGYTLDPLGSAGMIPGFEDQIAGHKIGETFDIDVTFPESYQDAELAGKPATFTITINYKNNTVVPELTDEFIASNTDYKTIDEYKTKTREKLTEDAAASDKEHNRQAVIESAMKVATVNSYPEEELKRLIDNTMENIENQAESYGYDLSSFVMAMGYQDVEEFRNYVKEDVQTHISEKIMICAVAKAENITVSKSEYEAHKKEMLDQTGYTSDEQLYNVYPKEDVLYYALAEKVADYLLSVATASPTDATASPTDAE